VLPRSTPDRASKRGVTIIEVTISILVLTVAAYILSSTISASLSHTVTKREQATAVEAAMNAMETLRASPFIDVFALYNDVDADDPLGPGTAPGSNFDVPGLDPIVAPGGNAAPLGTIVVPGVNGQLREDQDMAELGLPRDLSGDLVIDGQDHSDDYLVLPVIVRIRWQGRMGPREFEMCTMLVDLQKESEQQ
jgi:type II secretory pathway pseudopilin PulG